MISVEWGGLGELFVVGRGPASGCAGSRAPNLRGGHPAPNLKRRAPGWVELDAPVLERLRDARGTYRFWQRGGGYDRNIYSDTEFNEKIGYIHMNPVRAGLVRAPLEWAWISARRWSGEREGQVMCDQRGAGRSG